MKNSKLILVIGFLLVAAGGFFAGTKYQQSKKPAFPRQFTGVRTGQQQGQALRGGFRPVNGEIISAGEKSITVKLQDGSSRIVIVSENTQINKAQQVSKDELKIGEKVAVFGQENSDGSVTAQNIQLNPEQQRPVITP